MATAISSTPSTTWSQASGPTPAAVTAWGSWSFRTSRSSRRAKCRRPMPVLGAMWLRGGMGGTMGHPGPPALTFTTVKRHTHTSSVNLSRLPEAVEGTQRVNGKITRVAARIKDTQGALLGSAIPKVTIVKHARYLPEDASGDAEAEVDILARIAKNLREAPLAGFVAEGSAPFASMSNAVEAVLRRATLSGMPVVKVGRGNAEGVVDPTRATLALAGSNLTATKARLLLMACLLRFGSLPPALDPTHPTSAELQAAQARLAEYQAVFDTH